MSIQFLFNYKGDHIATFTNGQLYSVLGKNIGHYIESSSIFVDMLGDYLGQIPFANRLLQSDIYKYEGVNYGVYGDYGDIGYLGNIGDGGEIDDVEGFSDIPLERLE